MDSDIQIESQLRLFEGIDGIERYWIAGQSAHREVTRRDGKKFVSTLPCFKYKADLSAADAYDLSWLQSEQSQIESGRCTVSIADLFSGCGGLSLGFQEAARALGLNSKFSLAADIEAEYLDVYAANLKPEILLNRPIEQLIDQPLKSRSSETERSLQKSLKNLNVLIAGPPCQGHSDLNNYTRRADPKNNLYERVARVSELVQPEHVVIENVPGVRHDKSQVMQRTIEALQSQGYSVDVATIDGAKIGVPQRRRRTFIVGSLSKSIKEGGLAKFLQSTSLEPRSVGWAIEDLLNRDASSPFDQTSELSAESTRRVNWLFENGAYDLPDEHRPYCHREKAHTYKSVYGRMYWDRPSQTITTGFQVMGQGRFLHPLERRVITSHEAARLQFFPDFFNFGTRSRKGYAKMIGNAVPPKMGYVVGLYLLR